MNEGISFDQLLEICNNHGSTLQLGYSEIEGTFEIEVSNQDSRLDFYRKRTKHLSDFITYYQQHLQEYYYV